MTINWVNFTPWASLAGGALIGLVALIMILVSGRVAGISGIIGGVFSALLKSERNNICWRLLFLLGLLLAPFFYRCFAPLPSIQIDASPMVLIVAGLLVGVGTQMGSGCTSGHGVCGLARLSLRSLVATCLFMFSGFLTVFVIRHLLS